MSHDVVHLSTPELADVRAIEQEFTQLVLERGSQRERAFVVIQKHLAAVWATWHIRVAREKLNPSEADKQELNVLAVALKKVNLEFLLLRGLPPEVNSQLQTCLEMAPRRKRGRPAIYTNNAQRQKAYRDRKKQAQSESA